MIKVYSVNQYYTYSFGSCKIQLNDCDLSHKLLWLVC